MATTVLVASGKGGVGKSTITAGLGRAFSAAGIKTLLVDCDAALGSLDIMLGCCEEYVFGWLDVYNGTCTPEEAMLRINDNLYVIPAPRKNASDTPIDVIKTMLGKCSGGFDVVFVDSPAGIGSGFIKASLACDKALVIATPDEISVKGANMMAAEARRNGITDCRLILNRYRVKHARRGNLLSVDSAIDKTTVRLIGIVPEDENFVFSSVTGKPPSKHSPSEKAFGRICSRMLGKDVPLVISRIK